MKTGSLVLSFLFLSSTALAISFPAKARRSNNVGFVIGASHPHTAMVANGTTEGDDDDIEIRNSGDLVYSTSIKLGGKKYGVQIDTGSSDLWIYSPKNPVPTSKSTKFNTTVKYGRGGVTGPVAFAELEFGDYKVPSQAFINAGEAIDLESTLSGGNSGLLGLSFDSASEVDEVVRKNMGKSSTEGRTPISNIFHQNPKIPNFISVLLGRAGDLDDEVQGVFTISEYIEEFKSVEHEPKIPRLDVKKKGANKRWNAKIEGISVNGRSIRLQSALPKVETNTVVGMLDTGFSFPPVDAKIADAIYMSIPGSVKVADSETWIVPCLNSTELTFKIGGKEFPIHPLDLTIVMETEGSDGKRYTYCTNTFQGQNVAKKFGDLDMILGDSFLKNVYAIFDWGNESDGGKEGPFMQLLSTTTFTEAIPEFLQVRAESLKSLSSEVLPMQFLQLVGKQASKTAGDSVPGTDGKTNNFASQEELNNHKLNQLSQIATYALVVIGLLAASLIFLTLLSLIIVAIYIRGRGKAGSPSKKYAPIQLDDPEPHSRYSTNNTP